MAIEIYRWIDVWLSKYTKMLTGESRWCGYRCSLQNSFNFGLGLRFSQQNVENMPTEPSKQCP